MAAPELDSPAPNQRRRSFWRAAALAVLVVVLLPPGETSFGRLAVAGLPTAAILLAFQWRRPVSLSLGLAMAAVLLSGAFIDPRPLDNLWRGWAVLFGGSFVMVTALAPGRGVFGRALVAVTSAAGALLVAGVVRPEILMTFDARITAQYNQFFFLVEAGLEGMEGARAVVSEARRLTTAVFPAMIGLASLAALGVASYVSRRLEGAACALAPLREFRFTDHLAWVLVIGLLLLVAPVDGWGVRAGGNIVMFMSGLYVFRGLAVLAWMGTTVVSSGWWIAVWIFAAILFYPVTLGTALVMGLSDTWLDLRSGFGVEPNEK